MDQEASNRSQDGRQQESSSSGRRFLFIDASADRQTSSEAVRVHVMREAHRSRRERRGSQPPGPGRRPAAQDDMVIFDRRDTSRTSSATPPSSAAPEDRQRVPTPPRRTDWSTIVRTGVPQNTLDSVMELRGLAESSNRHPHFDAQLLSGTDLRRTRTVQPDVLHLCVGDLLALNAYLALATRQLTSSLQEVANVACAQFEARALELLRLRIDQTASMHTDATLVAILVLSQLEDKDNIEAALFHRNALRRLIHDRGGLSALKNQNKELHDILSRRDIVRMIS